MWNRNLLVPVLSIALRNNSSKFVTFNTCKLIGNTCSSPKLTPLLFRQHIANYCNLKHRQKDLVSYEEVKAYTKNKNVLIIDVREPKELREHGIIPGSINIPFTEVEYAFGMTEKDFQKRYKRTKPNEKTRVVFFSKCTKPALTAMDRVKKMGFRNVKTYEGGFEDWLENDDDITKCNF